MNTNSVVRDNILDKFVGTLVGCALGDAIGELAFSHPDEQALQQAIDRAEQLTYTDDTAMTIGLAEALLEVGRIDIERLGARFAENYFREPWRGYGPGPPKIFAAVAATGIPYAEAAKRLYGGAGSYGNGAAMRTAPVALAFRGAPDLYAQACDAASVTHAHPMGQDGAAVQAIAVSLALEQDTRTAFPVEKMIHCLITAAGTPAIREKMTLVASLIEQRANPREAANRIGRSIAVHESMPFAIYAFLRQPRLFERCLYGAVLNGGDRDTLGAMAGAVAGAYLGADRMPAAWRRKLENAAAIATLAEDMRAQFAGG